MIYPPLRCPDRRLARRTPHWPDRKIGTSRALAQAEGRRNLVALSVREVPYAYSLLVIVFAAVTIQPCRRQVADLTPLVDRMRGDPRATVLTGAGVSAASGVPCPHPN